MATRKIMMRNGYMKFLRLGAIEFGEQSRWSSRAPESKGMWAFPYPFFDMFFAYHKYSDLLPKRYRGNYPTDLSYYAKLDGTPVTYLKFDEEYGHPVDGIYLLPHYHEEKEAWIKNVGMKILNIKEFWYKGDVYTHFMPNGQIGSTDPFNEGNIEWSLMDVEHFGKNIRKTNGSNIYLPEYGGAFKSSIDHLEVFIPPKRGIIRHGKTPK